MRLSSLLLTLSLAITPALTAAIDQSGFTIPSNLGNGAYVLTLNEDGTTSAVPLADNTNNADLSEGTSPIEVRTDAAANDIARYRSRDSCYNYNGFYGGYYNDFALARTYLAGYCINRRGFIAGNSATIFVAGDAVVFVCAYDFAGQLCAVEEFDEFDGRLGRRCGGRGRGYYGYSYLNDYRRGYGRAYFGAVICPAFL